MSYNQNIASSTKYGSIKVGTGLSVTNGLVSANGITDANLGYFYSTQTQTNAASINIVTMNNTGLSQGISLVSNSRLTVTKSSNYNLSIMIQFIKSSSAGGSAIGYFWLRKNGLDVANSASNITTNENSGGVVGSWTYALPLVANDYLEMAWASTQSNATLISRIAQVGPPIIPQNPSVRMILLEI